MAHATHVRDRGHESHLHSSALAFPALAELPTSAQGVLIAPRWVITTAHNVAGNPVKSLTLAGKPRAVRGVVVHPGFKMPSPEQINENSPLLIATLQSIDDVALIELDVPVEDVAPMPAYRGTDEDGKAATAYGAEAQDQKASNHEKDSRRPGIAPRTTDIVETSKPHWVTFRSDRNSRIHPLGRQRGGRESGGPLVMKAGKGLVLIGLPSWRTPTGQAVGFRPSAPGGPELHVRVSAYADWVDGVIAQSSVMDRSLVDEVVIRHASDDAGVELLEQYTLRRGPVGYVLAGEQSGGKMPLSGPLPTRATLGGERALGDVDALLEALKAAPVASGSVLAQLADDYWTAENGRRAYAEIARGPCPQAEALFNQRFMDATARAAALSYYFNIYSILETHRFDDEGFYVSMTLSDGTTLMARSEAHVTPRLPWTVGTAQTWNIDLPRRVSALLPTWSPMRSKLTAGLDPYRFAMGLVSGDASAFEAAQLHCKEVRKKN